MRYKWLWARGLGVQVRGVVFALVYTYTYIHTYIPTHTINHNYIHICMCVLMYVCKEMHFVRQEWEMTGFRRGRTMYYVGLATTWRVNGT